MPEARSPSAPSEAAKKNSFCPPLYLPTSESSLWYFRYWKSFGPSQSRSFGSRCISLSQCTNITSELAAKSTPVHGCSQRQTDRPPNRGPIQPKIGVQIGSPVKRESSMKTGTDQWIKREVNR